MYTSKASRSCTEITKCAQFIVKGDSNKKNLKTLVLALVLKLLIQHCILTVYKL